MFILLWIRPVISIPVALALCYSLIETYRYSDPFHLEKRSNKVEIVIIVTILLIWVVSSGIGGLVWQNPWDHMFRNAIFNDLVHYDWPVLDSSYSDPRLLCYNFGFWLPSAMIGKLFGFQGGYFFQLIWAFIGVLLAFALISEYLKKVSILTAVIFVLFSGLDILLYFLGKIYSGSINTVLVELLNGVHLELKLYQFNSSSNTTLLYWVYNQTIPFWVGFMLLLRQKSNRSRLFVYMLILLYAPFPAVALVPMMLFLLLRKSNFVGPNGLKSIRFFFQESFTISNITGFCICLIIALFYMSNAATGALGFIEINQNTILEFGLYFVVEFLVFLAIILLAKKSNPILWILLTTMIVFSFVKLGNSYDFAWRTCIPVVFYCMLLITDIVVHNRLSSNRLLKIIVFFILILGCITPSMEILRTSRNTLAYIGNYDSVFASYFLAD
jgi:hypothetical protein